MDKRDNNVNMLYLLENVHLYKGASFSSTEQIQRFVDFITASEFWRREVAMKGVPGKIRVFSNGDNSFSKAESPDEIWLACQHWNQQVTLHELSHFFSQYHRPKFVCAYLNLISAFMGTEISLQYKQAFKLGKIRF